MKVRGLTLVGMVLLIMMPGCTTPWGYGMANEAARENIVDLGVYDADDAEDTATDDSDDTLMRIDWIEGGDDLDWRNVQFILSIADEVYYCSINANQSCLIQQHAGDDDNLWEFGEIIFISENGENIVGASGGEIDIHINYEGNRIIGTDSIYVV
jgi:hypothetical protein